MEVNPLQNSLYFNSQKEVWLRMCLKKWIYVSSFILYLTKFMIKHYYAVIHKTHKKNEFLNIILQHILSEHNATSWTLCLTLALWSGREAHLQNWVKISCIFLGLIPWHWKFSAEASIILFLSIFLFFQLLTDLTLPGAHVSIALLFSINIFTHIVKPYVLHKIYCLSL